MAVDLPKLVHAFSSLTAAAVTDDVAQRDQAQVEALLAHAARVQSLAESVRLAAVRRLADLARQDASIEPDEVVARHSRTSRRDAQRTSGRAKVTEQMPQLSDALMTGDVSVDHIDVIAQALGRLERQALGRLEPDERVRLADQASWIAIMAANCTPEELAKKLRRRVRELSSDDGIARFERQRRASTIRSWIDPDTGMCRLAGEFDPESGARLMARLRQEVETKFHGPLPETCPDDDRKQGHLTALALLDLVTGTRPSSGPDRRVPEFIVVIDQQTLWHGFHAQSRVEITGDVQLPLETLRRLACMADIIPVVLGGDGVARDVGRALRIATPAQRRAMRAMYSTCAVPGCCVPFDQCDLHHIRYWRNGGRSDLGNFVPLCSKHHHCVHEGGWTLHLSPSDRVLTITLPDGTTRANPPPYAVVA